LPTILEDARRSHWLPKMWKPFWIGRQRFLLIFHLTRLAFGFNLDIGEGAGSLNLHFGPLILKVSLFIRPSLYLPRVKKLLESASKSDDGSSLSKPFRLLTLSWDPTHLGLAIVLDPWDRSYSLNVHVASLVLSLGIPVRPAFGAASRNADLNYLNELYMELGGTFDDE